MTAAPSSSRDSGTLSGNDSVVRPMIERAITFGPDGALVGILAEPDASRAVPGAPAVLMWNVGINHHVGPYRFNVELSRALAERGFASLRFDVSGMGDSDVRKEGRAEKERMMADVRDAIALVEKRRGAKNVVLVGFCSSVDAAHAVAVKDERVAGMCYVEGYTYKTRGFWLHYPKRFLDVHRWQRFLASRFPRVVAGPTGDVLLDPRREERAAQGSVFVRDYPTREEFGTDVERMAKRGSRLLFLYVGGDTTFNHANQFHEMIGPRDLAGCVEVQYYDKADHTFYRVSDRNVAIERIVRWAEERFGAAASSSSSSAGRARTGTNGR